MRKADLRHSPGLEMEPGPKQVQRMILDARKCKNGVLFIHGSPEIFTKGMEIMY